MDERVADAMLCLRSSRLNRDSLRKAHFNPSHKALMRVCGIQEDGMALKYALFSAHNGEGGMKNSVMHHLSIPC